MIQTSVRRLDPLARRPGRLHRHRGQVVDPIGVPITLLCHLHRPFLPFTIPPPYRHRPAASGRPHQRPFLGKTPLSTSWQDEILHRTSPRAAGDGRTLSSTPDTNRKNGDHEERHATSTKNDIRPLKVRLKETRDTTNMERTRAPTYDMKPWFPNHYWTNYCIGRFRCPILFCKSVNQSSTSFHLLPGLGNCHERICGWLHLSFTFCTDFFVRIVKRTLSEKTPSLYAVLVDWSFADRTLTEVGVFASAVKAETSADQMAFCWTVVFLDWNFLTYFDKYNVLGYTVARNGEKLFAHQWRAVDGIHLRTIGLGSRKSTRIEGFAD